MTQAAQQSEKPKQATRRKPKKPAWMALAKPDTDPDKVLPDKPRFYMTDLAKFVATRLEITPEAARHRLYRGLQKSGPDRVRAVRVMGTIMVTRDEAVRLLRGEPT